jgi:phenylalanyl-tRNA synthetase beta chain
MKISIAWVFDHIDADVAKVDVPKLIERFNATTAEIEGFEKVKIDLDLFSLAQLRSIEPRVKVHSPEWDLDGSLSKRDDLQAGHWYLIIKREKMYDWATSADLGGQKDMFLPAVLVSAAEQKGGWKKKFEATDYIFTVDNKSITHRPDLWGHRGFAREIAALLNLPLKPLADFVVDHEITTYDHPAPVDKDMPFRITIENREKCHRFAGLYMPKVVMSPSLLWMASRLSRVDSRSINAVVDFTNYVMLDLSQPMHAFDATALKNKSIVARSALNKEKLTLLDDQTIELSQEDLVISDGDGPVALAGIMGGKQSAVNLETTTLFLESANFEAAGIRRTAQRYKLRTEASARFEKSLDLNQNTDAILRFLKLLDDANIPHTSARFIASLGRPARPLELPVQHSFIESRLGTTVAPEFVVHTLKKLDFGVKKMAQDDSCVYQLLVPTFRSTKDITIPIDIVEEVGRFYGYSSIPFTLPLVETRFESNYWVHQIYKMKELLAFGLSMRELYSYALFDESFLRSIHWEPSQTAQIQDPVSENLYRLVTTLMPNLLKAVQENSADHDQLRFFEWGRCWEKYGTGITETKLLSGIIFDKKKPVDFYDAKALLEQFFAMLHLPVQWQHADTLPYPWFHDAQTAVLIHEGKTVGMAGVADPHFLKEVTEGYAFIFELNGDFFERYMPAVHRFVPMPKYPAVDRDVSVLVPLSLTVDELIHMILNVNNKLTKVELVDMFQKKEWKDQRSLTMRYTMRDETKTMTKAEVDVIHAKIVKTVEAAGATVR